MQRHYQALILAINSTQPLPWIFVIAMIGTSVPQIILLNMGLSEFKATKFVPIYEVLLMICGVLFQAIYYQEYTAIHAVGFPIGMLFVCGGKLVSGFLRERLERHSQQQRILDILRRMKGPLMIRTNERHFTLQPQGRRRRASRCCRGCHQC